MIKHIWTGLGIAIGVALWPIVLPVLVLTLLVACVAEARKQQQSTKPTKRSTDS